MCKFARKTKCFPISHDAKSFSITSFLNCESKYIVYVIQCMECNLCYVGCTIRNIKICISEHLSAISKSQLHHSGAVAHFLSVHGGETSTFAFYGVETVPKPLEGGDWWKALLSHEAFWILRLGTRAPNGLNLRNNFYLLY